MRSSLKTIIPNGFLPAPLAVKNAAGLTVVTTEEEGSKFLSLFQRLSINLVPDGWQGTDKFSVPYDVCCPTVSNLITNRTCNVCKMYFPSNVMAVQQKKQLHPKVKITEVPRTRPVRIAARRQRELMAIIASGMYNVVLLHNNAIPYCQK